MAYTPTEWKKGDIVSSAKLNKMEEGIANAGPLVVTLIPSGSMENLTLTTDKTTAEIFTALPMAYFVVSLKEGSTTTLNPTDWATKSGKWLINLVQQTTVFQLTSESADSPMSATITIGS